MIIERRSQNSRDTSRVVACWENGVAKVTLFIGPHHSKLNQTRNADLLSVSEANVRDL